MDFTRLKGEVYIIKGYSFTKFLPQGVDTYNHGVGLASTYTRFINPQWAVEVFLEPFAAGDFSDDFPAILDRELALQVHY